MTRFKCTERFAFGFADPRCLLGSLGVSTKKHRLSFNAICNMKFTSVAQEVGHGLLKGYKKK